jgi:membrane protease YdiL (CAAX protease family)
LIFTVGAAFSGTLSKQAFIFESFSALLVATALAAIKGPIEEFGWRGFAAPLLQRKFAPFWSAQVFGFIWGFWHLPAFSLSGTQQSEWSFTAFFFGCLAISVIAIALFNKTGGSILL